MIAVFARRLLFPSLFAIAGLAILIALGVWQLHRKEWKEALIATLDRQSKAEPVPLPPPSQWPSLTPDNSEFRRVRFAAAFKNENDVLLYTGASALRPDVKAPGYFIFTPVTLTDGRRIVVNRGYLPTDTYPGRAGTEEIVGYIRFPEQPSLLRDFSVSSDTSRRVWTMRDHSGMAKARDWGEVAPFYIDQESPVPGPGLPRPGKLTVHLRNDHLGYALTWFGLAAALAAVFAAWVAREWYLITSEPPRASL
jgi:cytochrome oxidase assembly protein ShyY1